MEPSNSNNNNHNFGYTLITLLAGISIGAILVALTTNKTGSERRQELEELSRKLKIKAENLNNDANEAWDKIKSYTAIVSDNLKNSSKSQQINNCDNCDTKENILNN